MSVAQASGLLYQAPVPNEARVRDLLRRCGRTRDRAERAAILARVARELDLAADEISAHAGADSWRDVVAGLRGQASMARFMAELERQDRAREMG